MKAEPILTPLKNPGEAALEKDAPSAGGRGIRFRLILLLSFAAVLSVAYGRSLIQLIAYAAEESLHSHILLVPLISGYLIYLQRQILPRFCQTSPAPAALALAVGLLVLGAGLRLRPELSHGDFLSFCAFSYVCLLIAGALLTLGGKWMMAIAFPVAFLYFIVPLPDAAVNWLETALKFASADAANVLFSITGSTVFREGLVFQLPGITLEVAQECSGIRSSWVLFITSLVASYVLLRSSWRRAAILLLVLPLAVFRNAFRILVIGLLCIHIGPHMIHSFLHTNGGPVFFGLSLVPLFLLLWWLRRGETSFAVQKKHHEHITPSAK